MVAVNSTMVELGTPAPAFDLPDPSGTRHTLQSVSADRDALVVAFICNHCPYVKHIARELGLVTQQFMGRNVGVVGIMSNDIENYPEDGPEQMAQYARSVGWDFPYLLDEDQAVATAYRAACTPDFFVYDSDLRLSYRGQFDDARPSSSAAPTGADLRAAVNAAVAGTTPDTPQHPSMGCNIKWKPGNEPDYFG